MQVIRKGRGKRPLHTLKILLPVTLHHLYQFNPVTWDKTGIQKRDHGSMKAGPWISFPDFNTLGRKLFNRSFQIFHFQGDMINSLSLLLNVFGYRPIRRDIVPN